jgi:hypothetical protein
MKMFAFLGRVASIIITLPFYSASAQPIGSWTVEMINVRETLALDTNGDFSHTTLDVRGAPQ